ncbi:unnamed protein product [Oikopleura dioica]|uniref:Uncharacterized protein n=1 Tax=Oikopleura dioica TaxID=34765 RepID=E4WZT2_OIKDI|nr:unnamed protein product [Oikopleura dioica]
MSSLKQNRRYSKKNRKPFIPPPPPPFLFNSAAEQYLGEDRFRQLKKEYIERYIGALDKAKQNEDLYEPYGSSSFDPESGTESTPTKSYENTDHYNAFVTSVTASRKKTTPLTVYKPFESRPTAGVYPAYSSTPLTSITTMTSSTRTSTITTSKPSTTQSTITKKTRMQVPKNDTIQASDGSH